MSTTRTVTGTVTAVCRRINRNGALWAEIDLDTGEHVLVFPKVHSWSKGDLVAGAELEITGRADGPHLFAHTITRRSR